MGWALIHNAFGHDDENVSDSHQVEVSGRFAAMRRLWAAAFAGRRKAATLAAAALALAVGYHVVFGANGLTVYMQKRADTRALKQQMVDLQRENEQMNAHVDRLRNDPDAVEHQAREDLHYAKPNEVIYAMPGK
jgi:cell division protein FtsB